MLLGVMAPQDRFGGTVSARLTTPENPLRAVTVIVEVADVPAITAAGELAAIVKSVKTNVALAEWDNPPLVPVTVTVYVATIVELQESVALAVGGTVTLLGVMDPQERFAGTVSVKETVPEKLPDAATVIVEVAKVPTFTAAGEVAVIVKSLAKLKVALVE